MNRDMDLIREILLACESGDDGWAPNPIKIDGYSRNVIDYHCLLIIEAGLAVGDESTVLGGGPRGTIIRLSWEGHEFIEASREPTRWEKAKDQIGKAGGATLPVWQSLLSEFALRTLGLQGG